MYSYYINEKFTVISNGITIFLYQILITLISDFFAGIYRDSLQGLSECKFQLSTEILTSSKQDKNYISVRQFLKLIFLN